MYRQVRHDKVRTAQKGKIHIRMSAAHHSLTLCMMRLPADARIVTIDEHNPTQRDEHDYCLRCIARV